MNVLGSLVVLIVVLIIVGFFLFITFKMQEDSWIKENNGVYVKHGVPAETPDSVLKQQEAINCAMNLYNQEKQNNIVFSSQCLGTCKEYVVDIVHVPRTEEDNLPGNQCADYPTKIFKFIELDSSGKIVRIVD